MRILHVEDDQDTRTLVAFILESEGWEVVSVEKASAALELATTGGFDLYLLDIESSVTIELDGSDATRWVLR